MTPKINNRNRKVFFFPKRKELGGRVTTCDEFIGPENEIVLFVSVQSSHDKVTTGQSRPHGSAAAK